jgi:hypothetical protein
MSIGFILSGSVSINFAPKRVSVKSPLVKYQVLCSAAARAADGGIPGAQM